MEKIGKKIFISSDRRTWNEVEEITFIPGMQCHNLINAYELFCSEILAGKELTIVYVFKERKEEGVDKVCNEYKDDENEFHHDGKTPEEKGDEMKNNDGPNPEPEYIKNNEKNQPGNNSNDFSEKLDKILKKLEVIPNYEEIKTDITEIVNEQVEGIRQEIQDLVKSQIEELKNNQIAGLKRDFDDIKYPIFEQKTDINKVKEEINKVKEEALSQNEKIDNQIASKIDSIDANLKSILKAKELNDQQLKSQNEDLETKNKDLNDQINALTRTNGDLRKEIRENKEEIAKLEAEAKENNDKINNLKTSLANVKNEIEKRDKMIGELIDKIKSLFGSKIDCSDIENSTNILEKIKLLSNKLDKIEGMLKEKDEKIAKKTGDLRRADDDKVQLKNQLEEERENYKKQLHDAKDKFDNRLQDENEKFAKNLEETKNKLEAEKETLAEELERIKKQLEEEKQTLMNQLDDVKMEAETKKAELENRLRTEFNEEKAATESEIANLKAELEDKRKIAADRNEYAKLFTPYEEIYNCVISLDGFAEKLGITSERTKKDYLQLASFVLTNTLPQKIFDYYSVDRKGEGLDENAKALIAAVNKCYPEDILYIPEVGGTFERDIMRDIEKPRDPFKTFEEVYCPGIRQDGKTIQKAIVKGKR